MSSTAEKILEVGAVLAEALVKLIPDPDERRELISAAERKEVHQRAKLADDLKFGPPDHEED